MPGPGSQACPKPAKGSRKREKAKAGRLESNVITRVRVKVDLRDGHCRAGTRELRALLGSCGGPDEWAHLKGHQRWETRGLPPEERHTTGGSVKMCHRHHQGLPNGYDRHGFTIEPVTDRGADGPLRWVRRDGVSYQEPDLDGATDTDS